MKSRTRIALLLSVLATFAIAQEPAKQDKALELVQAMHNAEIYNAGIRAGMQKAADDGQILKPAAECVMGLDLGFVNDMTADILRKNLTQADIEEALAFYVSRAGRMTLQTSFAQARAMFPEMKGLPAGEDLGEPTREEKQQILQYTTSAVARKLMVLNTQDGLKDIQEELTRRLREQCFKQP
jgi:hypothetical protein